MGTTIAFETGERTQHATLLFIQGEEERRGRSEENVKEGKGLGGKKGPLRPRKKGSAESLLHRQTLV